MLAMRSLLTLLLCACACASAANTGGAAGTSGAAAASCRCAVSGWLPGEHATGIGEAVQLSWQLSHPSGPATTSARGAVQRAFELVIEQHGAAGDGGDLHWRSDAVLSPQQRADTADLPVRAGEREELRPARLAPGASFTFRVKATLSTGAVARCAGTFETAPETSVFPGAAKWIGGDGGGQLHAVQGLTLPGGTSIQSARAYVSGVGAFYLYINGEQVRGVAGARAFPNP